MNYNKQTDKQWLKYCPCQYDCTEANANIAMDIAVVFLCLRRCGFVCLFVSACYVSALYIAGICMQQPISIYITVCLSLSIILKSTLVQYSSCSLLANLDNVTIFVKNTNNKLRTSVSWRSHGLLLFEYNIAASSAAKLNRQNEPINNINWAKKRGNLNKGWGVALSPFGFLPLPDLKINSFQRQKLKKSKPDLFV